MATDNFILRVKKEPELLEELDDEIDEFLDTLDDIALEYDEVPDETKSNDICEDDDDVIVIDDDCCGDEELDGRTDNLNCDITSSDKCNSRSSSTVSNKDTNNKTDNEIIETPPGTLRKFNQTNQENSDCKNFISDSVTVSDIQIKSFSLKIPRVDVVDINYSKKCLSPQIEKHKSKGNAKLENSLKLDGKSRNKIKAIITARNNNVDKNNQEIEDKNNLAEIKKRLRQKGSDDNGKKLVLKENKILVQNKAKLNIFDQKSTNENTKVSNSGKLSTTSNSKKDSKSSNKISDISYKSSERSRKGFVDKTDSGKTSNKDIKNKNSNSKTCIFKKSDNFTKTDTKTELPAEISISEQNLSKKSDDKKKNATKKTEKGKPLACDNNKQFDSKKNTNKKIDDDNKKDKSPTNRKSVSNGIKQSDSNKSNTKSNEKLNLDSNIMEKNSECNDDANTRNSEEGKNILKKRKSSLPLVERTLTIQNDVKRTDHDRFVRKISGENHISQKHSANNESVVERLESKLIKTTSINKEKALDKSIEKINSFHEFKIKITPIHKDVSNEVKTANEAVRRSSDSILVGENDSEEVSSTDLTDKCNAVVNENIVQKKTVVSQSQNSLKNISKVDSSSEGIKETICYDKQNLHVNILQNRLTLPYINMKSITSENTNLSNIKNEDPPVNIDSLRRKSTGVAEESEEGECSSSDDEFKARYAKYALKREDKMDKILWTRRPSSAMKNSIVLPTCTLGVSTASQISSSLVAVSSAPSVFSSVASSSFNFKDSISFPRKSVELPQICTDVSTKNHLSEEKQNAMKSEGNEPMSNSPVASVEDFKKAIMEEVKKQIKSIQAAGIPPFQNSILMPTTSLGNSTATSQISTCSVPVSSSSLGVSSHESSSFNINDSKSLAGKSVELPQISTVVNIKNHLLEERNTENTGGNDSALPNDSIKFSANVEQKSLVLVDEPEIKRNSPVDFEFEDDYMRKEYEKCIEVNRGIENSVKILKEKCEVVDKKIKLLKSSNFSEEELKFYTDKKINYVKKIQHEHSKLISNNKFFEKKRKKHLQYLQNVKVKRFKSENNRGLTNTSATSNHCNYFDLNNLTKNDEVDKVKTENDSKASGKLRDPRRKVSNEKEFLHIDNNFLDVASVGEKCIKKEESLHFVSDLKTTFGEKLLNNNLSSSNSIEQAQGFIDLTSNNNSEICLVNANASRKNDSLSSEIKSDLLQSTLSEILSKSKLFSKEDRNNKGRLDHNLKDTKLSVDKQKVVTPAVESFTEDWSSEYLSKNKKPSMIKNDVLNPISCEGARVDINNDVVDMNIDTSDEDDSELFPTLTSIMKNESKETTESLIKELIHVNLPLDNIRESSLTPPAPPPPMITELKSAEGSKITTEDVETRKSKLLVSVGSLINRLNNIKSSEEYENQLLNTSKCVDYSPISSSDVSPSHVDNKHHRQEHLKKIKLKSSSKKLYTPTEGERKIMKLLAKEDRHNYELFKKVLRHKEKKLIKKIKTKAKEAIKKSSHSPSKTTKIVRSKSPGRREKSRSPDRRTRSEKRISPDRMRLEKSRSPHRPSQDKSRIRSPDDKRRLEKSRSYNTGRSVERSRSRRSKMNDRSYTRERSFTISRSRSRSPHYRHRAIPSEFRRSPSPVLRYKNSSIREKLKVQHETAVQQLCQQIFTDGKKTQVTEKAAVTEKLPDFSVQRHPTNTTLPKANHLTGEECPIQEKEQTVEQLHQQQEQQEQHQDAVLKLKTSSALPLPSSPELPAEPSTSPLPWISQSHSKCQTLLPSTPPPSWPQPPPPPPISPTASQKLCQLEPSLQQLPLQPPHPSITLPQPLPPMPTFSQIPSMSTPPPPITHISHHSVTTPAILPVPPPQLHQPPPPLMHQKPLGGTTITRTMVNPYDPMKIITIRQSDALHDCSPIPIISSEGSCVNGSSMNVTESHPSTIPETSPQVVKTVPSNNEIPMFDPTVPPPACVQNDNCSTFTQSTSNTKSGDDSRSDDEVVITTTYTTFVPLHMLPSTQCPPPPRPNIVMYDGNQDSNNGKPGGGGGGVQPPFSVMPPRNAPPSPFRVVRHPRFPFPITVPFNNSPRFPPTYPPPKIPPFMNLPMLPRQQLFKDMTSSKPSKSHKKQNKCERNHNYLNDMYKDSYKIDRQNLQIIKFNKSDSIEGDDEDLLPPGVDNDFDCDDDDDDDDDYRNAEESGVIASIFYNDATKYDKLNKTSEQDKNIKTFDECISCVKDPMSEIDTDTDKSSKKLNVDRGKELYDPFETEEDANSVKESQSESCEKKVDLKNFPVKDRFKYLVIKCNPKLIIFYCKFLLDKSINLNTFVNRADNLKKVIIQESLVKTDEKNFCRPLFDSDDKIKNEDQVDKNTIDNMEIINSQENVKIKTDKELCEWKNKTGSNCMTKINRNIIKENNSKAVSSLCTDSKFIVEENDVNEDNSKIPLKTVSESVNENISRKNNSTACFDKMSAVQDEEYENFDKDNSKTLFQLVSESFNKNTSQQNKSPAVSPVDSEKIAVEKVYVDKENCEIICEIVSESDSAKREEEIDNDKNLCFPESNKVGLDEVLMINNNFKNSYGTDSQVIGSNHSSQFVTQNDQINSSSGKMLISDDKIKIKLETSDSNDNRCHLQSRNKNEFEKNIVNYISSQRSLRKRKLLDDGDEHKKLVKKKELFTKSENLSQQSCEVVQAEVFSHLESDRTEVEKQLSAHLKENAILTENRSEDINKCNEIVLKNYQKSITSVETITPIEDDTQVLKNIEHITNSCSIVADKLGNNLERKIKDNLVDDRNIVCKHQDKNENEINVSLTKSNLVGFKVSIPKKKIKANEIVLNQVDNKKVLLSSVISIIEDSNSTTDSYNFAVSLKEIQRKFDFQNVLHKTTNHGKTCDNFMNEKLIKFDDELVRAKECSGKSNVFNVTSNDNACDDFNFCSKKCLQSDKDKTEISDQPLTVKTVSDKDEILKDFHIDSGDYNKNMILDCRLNNILEPKKTGLSPNISECKDVISAVELTDHLYKLDSDVTCSAISKQLNRNEASSQTPKIWSKKWVTHQTVTEEVVSYPDFSCFKATQTLFAINDKPDTKKTPRNKNKNSDKYSCFKFDENETESVMNLSEMIINCENDEETSEIGDLFADPDSSSNSMESFSRLISNICGSLEKNDNQQNEIILSSPSVVDETVSKIFFNKQIDPEQTITETLEILGSFKSVDKSIIRERKSVQMVSVNNDNLIIIQTLNELKKPKKSKRCCANKSNLFGNSDKNTENLTVDSVSKFVNIFPVANTVVDNKISNTGNAVLEKDELLCVNNSVIENLSDTSNISSVGFLNFKDNSSDFIAKEQCHVSRSSDTCMKDSILCKSPSNIENTDSNSLIVENFGSDICVKGIPFIGVKQKEVNNLKSLTEGTIHSSCEVKDLELSDNMQNKEIISRFEITEKTYPHHNVGDVHIVSVVKQSYESVSKSLDVKCFDSDSDVEDLPLSVVQKKFKNMFENFDKSNSNSDRENSNLKKNDESSNTFSASNEIYSKKSSHNILNLNLNSYFKNSIFLDVSEMRSDSSDLTSSLNLSVKLSERNSDVCNSMKDKCKNVYTNICDTSSVDNTNDHKNCSELSSESFSFGNSLKLNTVSNEQTAYLTEQNTTAIEINQDALEKPECSRKIKGKRKCGKRFVKHLFNKRLTKDLKASSSQCSINDNKSLLDTWHKISSLLNSSQRTVATNVSVVNDKLICDFNCENVSRNFNEVSSVSVDSLISMLNKIKDIQSEK